MFSSKSMPNLRLTLILTAIWALVAGCSSPKQAPFVGDQPTNKSDASTPPIMTNDAGGDANAVDTGSGTPSICSEAGVCSVVLTAAATTIPADGTTVDVITASVGARVTGIILFSIAGPGTFGGTERTLQVAVDSNGKATANFTSDAAGGTAVITARLMGGDMAAQITIEMPALADITFTAQHDLMGVRSSGFNESNQITFKVLAPNGVPYPDGLVVNFEHRPLSGSTIGNQLSCTMLDCVVRESGKTSRGQVQLSLKSGTLQGTAIVTITATAGGQTKRVDMSSPIVGAKVSGSNVSIECSPRNVPALFDTDCLRSRVDSPFKCTVTLGDRFKNVVGVSTTVMYQSEAGIVGTPPATPMFPSPDLGKATGTIGTIGGVLPLDVFPIAGEYSSQFADVCHPTGPSPTHNPRDGIVSVIAMMAGEEGFIDKNGNGDYDSGEPFIDLAEPFVDSNDNGTWDTGEFFQDLNMDARWNGPNGSWDPSTTLWAETRIVYSGNPVALSDVMNGEYLSRFYNTQKTDFPPSQQFPMHPTPTFNTVLLKLNDTVDVGVWFSDLNFNVLAPAMKYTAEIGTGDPVTVTLAPYPAYARQEGFFFSQRYCDGSAPDTCGMVCPPATGTQQCIVKSAVTSFEYGVNGGVRIKASSSLTGSFSVRAAATLGSSIWSMDLGGTVGP